LKYVTKNKDKKQKNKHKIVHLVTDIFFAEQQFLSIFFYQTAIFTVTKKLLERWTAHLVRHRPYYKGD